MVEGGMKVALHDCLFSLSHQCSATLAGDNANRGPRHFEWDRENEQPVTFFTDSHLEEVKDVDGIKVAWLIEPPGLRGEHYSTAWRLRNEFDYILTFFAAALRYFNCRFYPFGGSWIAPTEHGLRHKSEMVSMIVSDKRGTAAHRLRHRAVEEFGDQIDVMGGGYDPIDSKLEGLADYRYAVIAESCQFDWYFTEKLIDPLTVGTVPIYRGCPSLGRFFDMAGIITWQTLDDLDAILSDVISEADYESRAEAIARNLERAKRYHCAEDWIFEQHPEIFEGKEQANESD